MDDIDVLYGVEEVAEILKISPKLVRTYIRGGKLKATKIGKYYRIQKKNLVKLIENGNNG